MEQKLKNIIEYNNQIHTAFDDHLQNLSKIMRRAKHISVQKGLHQTKNLRKQHVEEYAGALNYFILENIETLTPETLKLLDTIPDEVFTELPEKTILIINTIKYGYKNKGTSKNE